MRSTNALFVALAACGIVGAGVAQVKRPADIPATAGTSDNFTGKVSLRALTKPIAPGRASVGMVTFAPGARSFWHTHPAGQTLIVTAGCGWTQEAGGPVRKICKGDVVTVAPGVRHWHGAMAAMGMTHIAVTETIDGRNVDWKEPVSAAEYAGAAKTAK